MVNMKAARREAQAKAFLPDHQNELSFGVDP